MIDEYKLIISKTDDMVNAVMRGRPMSFSSFLTLDEQKLVSEHINRNALNYSIFGGYDDFERGIICVYDEYQPDLTDFPISVLCFELSDWHKIGHRDVLGALMSLGIKRELIGDIVFETEKCFIFVDRKICQYLLQNLFSVGNLKIDLYEYFDKVTCTREYEEIQIILSSLRLDCFVSDLCSVSRTKASEYIVSGQVYLNGRQELKKDKTVLLGDIITVRRYGKFRVMDDLGLTKKGRIKIKLLKYK